MDIFFVNNTPFLITFILKIDFTATSHLPTQKDRYIFKSFWSIYAFYIKGGFKITTVHSDGEFAPVREIIAEMSSGPMVSLTIVNEHVPKIERIIRVVKERYRSNRHSLHFMRLPVILTNDIVFYPNPNPKWYVIKH